MLSQLEPRMQGHNPIRQVLIGTLLHTHLFHHLQQLILWQEPLNRLHQVLITFGVVGNDLAHLGNHVEGVFAVEFPEKGVLHLAELQAHESSSRFQDSKRLFKGFSSSGDVSQPKGDRISVEGVVLKGKFLGVGADKLDLGWW